MSANARNFRVLNERYGTERKKREDNPGGRGQLYRQLRAGIQRGYPGQLSSCAFDGHHPQRACRSGRDGLPRPAAHFGGARTDGGRLQAVRSEAYASPRTYGGRAGYRQEVFRQEDNRDRRRTALDGEGHQRDNASDRCGVRAEYRQRGHPQRQDRQTDRNARHSHYRH